MADVPEETWRRIQALIQQSSFIPTSDDPPMRTIADRLELGVSKLIKERDDLRQEVLRLHEERGTVWTAGETVQCKFDNISR